jgi:hypothetical protein
MLPGVVGRLIEIEMHCGELSPQSFIAETHTLPSVLPKTTTTLFVPDPETTTEPVGTCQRKYSVL